jgi:hypothetical protein
MERIVPPIRPQDQGPAVANFQEALLFIVGGMASGLESCAKELLRKKMKRERASISLN